MSVFELSVLLSPWVAFVAYILWEVRNKEVDQGRRYERALVSWTRVLSFSTIGLVLATIVSAYILHRTDDAIHRQLNVMERDEQPFIVLADTYVQPNYESLPSSKSGGRMFWNFTFKNVGKRAATNFLIKKYTKIGNEKFIEGENFGILPYFGPSASQYFSFFDSRPTLSEFNSLMKQDHGIMAFVEFSYTDIHGTQLSTSFCVTHAGNNSIANLNPDTCRGRDR